MTCINRYNSFLKNTPFGILQQFPKPIEDKRRKLYPVLKDAKRQGKHAVLVRLHSILGVEGIQWIFLLVFNI
jgi:hypothetical protein